MSRLAVGAQTDRKDVLLKLKALVPEASIIELKHGLVDGTPFVEVGFPEHDWEEVCARLRGIVAALQAEGIEPLIYEFDDGDQGDDLETGERMTPAELENLLHRYEIIVAQRQELDRLRRR